MHKNSLQRGIGFRESGGYFFMLLFLKTLMLPDSCAHFSPSETLTLHHPLYSSTTQQHPDPASWQNCRQRLPSQFSPAGLIVLLALNTGPVRPENFLIWLMIPIIFQVFFSSPLCQGTCKPPELYSLSWMEHSRFSGIGRKFMESTHHHLCLYVKMH